MNYLVWKLRATSSAFGNFPLTWFMLTSDSSSSVTFPPHGGSAEVQIWRTTCSFIFLHLEDLRQPLSKDSKWFPALWKTEDMVSRVFFLLLLKSACGTMLHCGSWFWHVDNHNLLASSSDAEWSHPAWPTSQCDAHGCLRCNASPQAALRSVV